MGDAAKPGRKAIWVLILCLAGLGVLLLLKARSSPSSRTPVSRTAPVRPGIALPEKVIPTPDAVQVGEERIYSTRYRTELQVTAAETRQDKTTEFVGKLRMRLYQDGLVGFRFLELEGRQSLGETSGKMDLFEELRTEVLVRTTIEGSFQSVHFARETTPADRNTLRDLLARLDISVPEPVRENWSFMSESPIGRFRAKCGVLGRSEGRLRVSLEREYEELAIVSPQERKRFDATTGGSTLFLLDGSRRILAFEEQAEILLTGKAEDVTLAPLRFSYSSQASLRLEALTPMEGKVLADRAHALLECRRRTGFPTLRPEKIPSPEGPIPTGSIRGILTSLQGGLSPEEWRRNGSQAFLELLHLLEGSDEARREAEILLRSGAYSLEILKLLAQALGATTSGWKEILSLVRDAALDSALRIELIQSLAQSPQGSAEIRTALLEILAQAQGDELAVAAIGSLGAAAPGTGPEETAAGLAPFFGRSEKQDAAILNALGNLATPASIDPILSKAESPREETRSDVAFALRDLPGERVVQALEKLAQDKSMRVQQEAYFALSVRSDTESLSALERLLWNSDSGTRTQALHALAKRVSTDPSADGLLRKAAESHPSPETRSLAQDLLQERP